MSLSLFLLSADDDEADSDNINKLLRSENFLSADKTWRAQAQTQAAISWLNSIKDTSVVEDVEGFSSLESEENRRGNSNSRRTSSSNSKSSSSGSSVDGNNSYSTKGNPPLSFETPSFEVPTLRTRPNPKPSTVPLSASPTPSLSSPLLDLSSKLSPARSGTLSESASRRKSLASATEEKARIHKQKEEQQERTFLKDGSSKTPQRDAISFSWSAGKSVEDPYNSWEDTVEVLGKPDEVEGNGDSVWTVEELLLPLTGGRGEEEITAGEEELDWGYGPSLSRHRRDLEPGSGEVVGKC